MLPTPEARITRQMVYSATPPVTTFVRLAILPPDNATWVTCWCRKQSEPARSFGACTSVRDSSGDLAIRGRARIAAAEGENRTVHIWAGASCQEWTLRLGKGTVRGLEAFVLKLPRDARAGD